MLFTVVGYDDILCVAAPEDELCIKVDVKGDENWLTLEQAHQLRDALEHAITVVSSTKIKGT